MYSKIPEPVAWLLGLFLVHFFPLPQILGLKLLVAWLLGLQSDYDKASQPVVRLLDTVLAHDGDLQGEDNIRLDTVLAHDGDLQYQVFNTFTSQSRCLLVYGCGK